MKTAGILNAIRTTMGGLNTQMRRMEAISSNIANADKAENEEGDLYKRKVVVEERNGQKHPFHKEFKLKMQRGESNHFDPQQRRLQKNKEGLSYEVVEQDNAIRVYEPNHPMADKDGYVNKPDINVVEEMVDLVSTTRIYEANVTVINAAKNIAKKSLEI